MTTWTSLRRPLAKVGRSGRSISRQVRIASSDGRPSRRKNEPGMRPAAYIRSSTSTVSGKKSNWSLGWRPAVVADSSMVSPMVTVTEPAAWRASRPVSKVMLRLPKEPLSMTAVAVVTPSSGSNSAAVLLLWVGADTCPSLLVAPGRRDRRALFLSGRPGEGVGAPAASGATGLRSKPSGTGFPVLVPPERGSACPGATTEDRTASGARGSSALVRRLPHERGDRPADGPLVVLTGADRAAR